MTPEYTAYKKLIERKRKHLAKLQADLSALLEECAHEEIEQKSSYSPGGYMNTDYTDYWNECTLCGATSERTTVSHGCFG